MRRRELLTGSAALALSAGTAHAFGIGQLGAGEGHLGSLGVAGPYGAGLSLLDESGNSIFDENNLTITG